MPKIDLTPPAYFGVPTALVDTFLRDADEKKLKTLLYILRHSPRTVTVEELCRATGATVAATELIVEYWRSSGIFDGSLPLPAQPAEQTSRKKADAVEVARAAETDEALSFLLKRSQELMGRTLTRSESEALFSIYGWAGMPVEVLLMLIQYCASVDKGNMRYIEKLAYSWQDEGIAGYESAERKIAELKASDKAEAKIKAIVGIQNRNLTTSEKEHLRRWTVEWEMSWELITLAFEKTADATGKASFAYMNGILKSWREQGVKRKKDLEGLPKKAPKKSANRSFTEADIRAYEEWGRKKIKEGSKQ